jgi:hypothetical protein
LLLKYLMGFGESVFQTLSLYEAAQARELFKAD